MFTLREAVGITLHTDTLYHLDAIVTGLLFVVTICVHGNQNLKFQRRIYKLNWSCCPMLRSACVPRYSWKGYVCYWRDRMDKVAIHLGCS